MTSDSSAYLLLLYRRVFQRQDPATAQVSFDATVLDKYRASPAFELIRTDTAGRIIRRGSWSLDVGIAEGERVIHASLEALMHALPEGERDHWAQHVVALPMSNNFLQMQMTPASCIDDGELRDWE